MRLSNSYGGPQSYIDWKFSQPLFIEGGDPFYYSSGREIDGLPVSESESQRRLVTTGISSSKNIARLRSTGEMKPWTVLTFISMVFFNCNSVEAKAWRGIEPLHSTRADVERLFGSQVVRCGGSACIYELAEEIAFILYASDSGCKNDDATTAWKVPVGTVIEIGVRFKEEKALSELPFDLTKFLRVEDKHLPGWIYYVNLDEGVRVEGGLKTVSSVTYFNSAKDYDLLHCPSTKKAKPSNTAREDPAPG